MNHPAPAGPASSVRCFIALLPTDTSVQRLLACRDDITQACGGATRGVRWLEARALHLTLRFLGDAGSAQVDYLRHMLPTWAEALPALRTRRHAIWPNRVRPRMLVLEFAGDAALSARAADCEAHARKAGFAAETHDFRPHLTLARLRPGCGFGMLPPPPPTLEFDAIALLRSTLATPAATYTELARVPLPRMAP